MNENSIKKMVCDGARLYLGPLRIAYENFFDFYYSGLVKTLMLAIPSNDMDMFYAIDCAGHFVRRKERIEPEDWDYTLFDVSRNKKFDALKGCEILVCSDGNSKVLEVLDEDTGKPITRNKFYAGAWVYAELVCFYDGYKHKGKFTGEFKVISLKKYKDDKRLFISALSPLSKTQIEEIADEFNNRYFKGNKSGEQIPDSDNVFLPLSLGGLFNRNHFERMLEHYGADNPSKLASALRAYSTLSNKLYYYKSRDYDKEMCDELLSIFKKDVKYWNSLVEKGLRFYQGTKRLLPPSYMLGFVALWVLDDSAEEHCVFDYLGQITGKAKAVTTNTKELFSQLKKHHRRYGQFPSEDLQEAIMDGWLKFYDEQYKLREAK